MMLTETCGRAAASLQAGMNRGLLSAQCLSAGMTIDEILADYEDLERADILAALAFATRLSQVKRMQPIVV